VGRVSKVQGPPSSRPKIVHVGETFYRFAHFGQQKCVWRPGSARTRWGSYSAPPNPLAVIRGRARREGERKGWKLGREEREERKDVKG